MFTYDAVGNLTSKTGVGTAGGNLGATYLYPAQGSSAIRPHAVDSIPGIGSFAYDDNGNLLSGAGRSLTWTSFQLKGPDFSPRRSEHWGSQYVQPGPFFASPNPSIGGIFRALLPQTARQ
ncbi:MAG: hypothetical protein ING75_17730 [Rhodocyclaceae bacterium]|nr:hypothetical protein [Rhodocyclaceae bacterium]